MNQNIKASSVLVIGADGSNLGVLSLSDALKRAEVDNLDLVQVSPGDAGKNVPPTCKIMNYGKHCYEQEKRGREARKKQKVVVTKEIRLSLNIGEKDFETKLGRASSFLERGDKVKVCIKFKGRETINSEERGYGLMQEFAKGCEHLSRIESAPVLEGKNMHMILSAKSIQNKGKKRVNCNAGSSEIGKV